MLQKYNNMCLIIRVYSITLMCVAVCFDTHTEVTWNVEFLHTAGLDQHVLPALFPPKPSLFFMLLTVTFVAAHTNALHQWYHVPDLK